MTTDNTPIALAALSQHLAKSPLEFVISEGDLVTVAAREVRGTPDEEYEFFSFHTFEIVAGEIVAWWANIPFAPVAPDRGEKPRPRPTVTAGAGDPAQHKQQVADFYRAVSTDRTPMRSPTSSPPTTTSTPRTCQQDGPGLKASYGRCFPTAPSRPPMQPISRPSFSWGKAISW